MDEDVDRLDRDGLVAEVKRLRAGIRAHRDSRVDTGPPEGEKA